MSYALNNPIYAMPKRNSPNTIRDLNDLSSMGEVVVDKRQGQRSSAKKNRRNRHYEKQFIRNALALRMPLNEKTVDSIFDNTTAP